MTLREKQSLFTMLVAKLILWAVKNDYYVTFGETYRTEQQAQWNADHGKGIVKSLHCKRLAVDFNLFVADKYMTGVEDYRPLGEYWESMHELARWGGRWTTGTTAGDAGHFSLEHEGVK